MMHDALLGEKLGHSLSVPIHEVIFERLGIDADDRLIGLPRDTFAAAEPRRIVVEAVWDLYSKDGVAREKARAAFMLEWNSHSSLRTLHEWWDGPPCFFIIGYNMYMDIPIRCSE